MTNVLTDGHGNVIEPRTIAADIMTANARDVDHIDVWAHIGQAYDVDVVEANIDASIANEVIDLIGKAGIDLIWPDGTKNTELDAARVEIERLNARNVALCDEIEQLRGENAELRKVAEAAQEWVEHEGESAHQALLAAVDGLPPEVTR